MFFQCFICIVVNIYACIRDFNNANHVQIYLKLSVLMESYGLRTPEWTTPSSEGAVGSELDFRSVMYCICGIGEDVLRDLYSQFLRGVEIYIYLKILEIERSYIGR